ncbi:UNVERIFIED_CONTAM: hypothetical protein GTU68_020933 [Idotea baltica]|nr:hypothetical protein [Idotea baltica]
MTTIIVRSTEPDDAPAVKSIFDSPSAYAGTLQLPYPSHKMWTDRLSAIPENVHSFVAEVNGEVVGNLGFQYCLKQRRNHAGYFGMAVKDGYEGMGVGSALMSAMIDLSDNWLNVRRIELTVYTDNERAIGLYKKFGFVIEGEARDFAFRQGEYVNAYYMARLKA